MWDVLKEYPTARIRLEAIATKRLEKYKTDPNPDDKLEGEHSTTDCCRGHATYVHALSVLQILYRTSRQTV